MQYGLLLLYLTILVPVSALTLFPIGLTLWLITLPFDRRQKLLHRFCCFWTDLYILLVPGLKLHRNGLENISRGEQYMIVSNHQAFLDIILGNALKIPFKWVSKVEVFRIPIYGWMMSLNRYIALKRGDQKSIKKMMVECDQKLLEGNSLFIFPEGTRSKDGQLGSFKPGAFILAKKRGVAILPVVMDGSANALEKSHYRIFGNPAMSVTVLPPIRPEQYASLSTKELCELTQKQIADKLAELNQ